ncbi:hypothetical protein EDD15DRAFT_872248 [Pisolithus albus]|nr:hypothetical protein EDD15DRAFT_872248 [Pisolithus albus]
MRYIRDVITVCLVIALSIQPMTGTHHALFQIVEVAALLINMVVQHVKQARQTRISADMKTAIGEVEEETKGAQDIVRDPTQRTPEARRILRSPDSTSTINHDFGSMDDGFEARKRGLDIENCSCGISVGPEQSLSH